MECCATCKRKFNLTKDDYSNGGCEHTKLDGFVCMAFAPEDEAVWMVGVDATKSMCECYAPWFKNANHITIPEGIVPVKEINDENS